jgi:hypothetical protein
LTYENFKDNKVLPSDLNVSPADEESV